LQKIAQGMSVHGEIKVITPIGLKTAEYRSNPIWQDGKIIGSQTTIRDISERKKPKKICVQNQIS